MQTIQLNLAEEEYASKRLEKRQTNKRLINSILMALLSSVARRYVCDIMHTSLARYGVIKISIVGSGGSAISST